jgi:glycine cleavage system H protein
MQAGVVKMKICPYHYNCGSCEYDQAMSVKMKRLMAERELEPASAREFEKTTDLLWPELLKLRSSGDRKCRHMLLKEVPFKLCPNAFRCWTCEYDQMVSDRIARTIPIDERDLQMVEGFLFPADPLFFFHRGHTWIHLENGGHMKVGIDDMAARLIGSVKKPMLPKVGDVLQQGQKACAVTSDGRTINLQSPVDGVVTSINVKVLNNPGVLLTKPYSEGWLFTVDVPDLRKANKVLLSKEKAQSWMTQEAQRLDERLQDKNLGKLAADGGHIVESILDSVGSDAWNSILKEFLESGNN